MKKSASLKFPQLTTWLALLVAGSYFLAASPQVKSEEQQTLTEFMEAFTLDILRNSPESITFIALSDEEVGRKTSHLLDDRSLELEQKIKSQFLEFVEKLKTFDTSNLSEDEQIYLDIFDRGNELAMPLMDFQIPFAPGQALAYRISQINGPHLNIPLVMQAAQPMKTKENAQDFIARMRAIKEAFTQFTKTWKTETDAGYIPPKFSLEKISATLGAFSQGAPEANPFFQIFAARLAEVENLTEEEKEALIADAKEAVIEGVHPGYSILKEAVDALIPGASEDAGVWRVPRGDEFYTHAVKIYADTDLTPEEIHQLGLAEVARISAEIDSIFISQGMTEGTVGERLKALGENPDFIYPDNEEGHQQLVSQLEGILEEVNAIVPEYFGRIPEADVVIQRVPEYSEASSAIAFYTPPSLDGARPGTYWVNFRDMAEQKEWIQKAVLLHEAVPGHHFEFALAFTADERPLFRRIFGSTVFSEGWGLYSERLGKEMGMFENDPFGDIGRLQLELWRAVRLVVDTGLHYKRWSWDEAVEYAINTSGSDRQTIIAEIERYAVFPGQALSYYLGMQKILEMRAKAKAALGNDFDIKVFHDLVLGKGPMPLTVVEKRVDAWVARQSGESQ